MRSIPNTHQKLAKRAYRYKRAWLLCGAWTGFAQHMSDRELDIHAYERFTKSHLKSFLKDIEDDYLEIVQFVLSKPTKQAAKKALFWFEQTFIEWQTSGNPIYCIGNYQTVDRAIGPLRFPEQLETPPYAELILQGYHGCCCRHPEYMLGRDLSLTYNLFLDAENHCDNSAIDPTKTGIEKGYAAENALTLGRLVFITAYNLVESFISGLELEARMNGQLTDEAEQALLKMKMAPLRKRFHKIPFLITGKPVSDAISEDKTEVFFGEMKRRRDAFVHCIPGTEPGNQGHVRQLYFHDIQKDLVTKVVDLTIEMISAVWKMVHHTDRPRWLPDRDESGRFASSNLTLAFPNQPKD